MLGLVFTEFVECVETGFGLGTADRVQRACPFHTNFTAVDIYDHQQLIVMVTKLHEATGLPIEQLVRGFGHHIFSSFAKNRADAFAGIKCTEQLLRHVENVIHLDVRSIYPDAELPQFRFPESPAGEIHVEYLSSRPFAELAHGMIESSIQYFGEDWQIKRIDLDGPPGTHALFELTTSRS
jgi:Haem-NO-binding